eukprot:TRINITY_DN1828_c0_g1_i2.p1 TRINITY_DN1828_c0_g1~~TRINITY_DN1828_c0_g1_i2.p1  ORF type:complete len:346 (+),score=61.92 TRINITY_DN1828_c0_g1_i2:343-1380(+)
MSSSFPSDLGYGEELPIDNSIKIDENIPRILLTGPKSSGKSSIQKVVFHKMAPVDTLFLEPTSDIIKNDVNHSTLVNFQIWDAPGDLDFQDPTMAADQIFQGCGALIYVINAQDDYQESLARLHSTVTRAYEINPSIRFEVFIHKVDGLTDDAKLDVQRNIIELANGELFEAKLTLKIHLNFYLTSIYDHSIFEAFSKVIQKLIPQLPTLESLLDILISNCRMEKAFLIDIVSKIYVATDSSPVDMQTYELCSDMIDVVIDISSIYGAKDEGTISHDPETQSIIKLNNGTVLYLREVNRHLALVCHIREDKFEKHGLIDYNFECLKNAIKQVFEVGKKLKHGSPF